jgi:hypothetical protein
MPVPAPKARIAAVQTTVKTIGIENEQGCCLQEEDTVCVCM